VPRLILASRSPRRRALLEEAGYRVECDPEDVGELTAHDESPAHLALDNARRKSLAVAARRADDVVLGADTIVVLDGEIFGKPRDLDHAFAMLSRLAGRIHEVITGVCVVCRAQRARVEFSETTRVRFRALDAGAIRDYLARIEPLDKAGAYAAQDDGGRIIECVEGSFSNVVGLPMERTRATLDGQFGLGAGH
jgi:septum formation protein